MFFTTKNGSVINTNYIISITPIRKRQIKAVFKDLFTVQEFAAMGFRVGRKDVFISTKTWDEARKAVSECPNTRKLSQGCTGYTELACGDVGLIDQYYEYDNGNFHSNKDDLFFLPKEAYDEVIAYSIEMHMLNVNYQITVDEFKKLKKMLDAENKR